MPPTIPPATPPGMPPGMPPAGAGLRSVRDLVRRGVLDAELAGLAWLLLEQRVSLVVAGLAEAGPGRVDRTALAAALAGLLPASVRRLPVVGDLERLTAADAAGGCLVGLDLGDEPRPDVRLAFRSLGRGAQLVASVRGDSLEDVHARLRARDIGLTDDELTFLGVVLVVRPVEASVRDGAGETESRGTDDRVVVAHYARPLARDPGGHVQRMGPAVLAALDERDGRFDHFSWGIAAELAGRAGLRPGDMDAEIGGRRGRLLAAE